MRFKLVTNGGRVLEDPTAEAEASVTFGIKWHNGSRDEGLSKVISPFVWTLSAKWGDRLYTLRDCHGEVRQAARWGDYHPAVEFVDWAAYDAAQTEAEMARIKKSLADAEKDLRAAEAKEARQHDKLWELRRVMAQVFDITSDGGPGSRVRVKTLLREHGIQPCDECGRAVCVCEEDENDPEDAGE